LIEIPKVGGKGYRCLCFRDNTRLSPRLAKSSATKPSSPPAYDRSPFASEPFSGASRTGLRHTKTEIGKWASRVRDKRVVAIRPPPAPRSRSKRAQVAAEFTPMFARRPDAALANWSLAHVEPVSCTRKRKLEYGEQRLARQNRLFRPETLEIAGQRLRRARLTRGNVGGSHKHGNNVAETGLAG
jgi:hypothetical protein